MSDELTLCVSSYMLLLLLLIFRWCLLRSVVSTLFAHSFYFACCTFLPIIERFIDSTSLCQSIVPGYTVFVVAGFVNAFFSLNSFAHRENISLHSKMPFNTNHKIIIDSSLYRSIYSHKHIREINETNQIAIKFLAHTHTPTTLNNK